MSTKTTNLSLEKPAAGDKFSITGSTGYNDNMDKIDAAIGQLNSDLKNFEIKNNILIYRIGRLRILSFSMVSTKNLYSVILDTSDRPSAIRVSSIVIHYSNGRYSKIGFVAVQTTGAIEAYKTSGYDGASSWVKVDSNESDLISGSIIYSI